MRSLRRRGVLASYGEASGDPEPVPPRKLGHLGSIFLTHPSLPDYTATRADLLETANDLFAMVTSGKVKIEISHTYALRDAPQAHADLEARKTTGSIVLIPEDARMIDHGYQTRTWDELKAETLARAERGAYPVFAITPDDARAALSMIHDLDPDAWGSAWMAVGDRSMERRRKPRRATRLPPRSTISMRGGSTRSAAGR